MSADVFVLHTALAHYSDDWARDGFAEGSALRSLCRLAEQRAGYHMFRQTIVPGNTVVVKPNLVRDWHPAGQDLYSIIAHPAIIRAVVDEVYDALHGEGRIIIADAPMADTDFDHLLSVTGLAQIADLYWRKHRFEVEIRDLRQYGYRFEKGAGGYGHEVRLTLAGDPEGYATVDLGAESAFVGLDSVRLVEGTDIARRRETIGSHTGGANRYLISRTVLNSDVLVSVPKLKVHGKVGITVNCKNMVGINGDKNLLPHFRWGGPQDGGDQFPPRSQSRMSQARMRLGRLVADQLMARQSRVAGSMLSLIQWVSGSIAAALRLGPVYPVNGDWPGNDTCWRLAVDLVRVALLADREGKMRSEPQRRFLSIVDGIVGGEKDGPLSPTPKPCGTLIAGTNPLAVDLVAARLMGFDPYRIRYLRELSEAERTLPGYWPLPPERVKVMSNHGPWQDMMQTIELLLGFVPPARWEGWIEMGACASTQGAGGLRSMEGSD